MGINQRNKQESKQKLIDAVGTIILREGFKGIGINSVAKEAGVDKVLIYRYFNGMEGLLFEYIKQKDFYISTSGTFQGEIERTEKHELTNVISKVLIGQLRGLIQNRELQELMLWEMVEKNELTLAIAKEREEIGYEISKTMKSKMSLSDNDSDAIIALLVAGIYYLVLRSRTVDIFNGIKINTEEGWQQIEVAIQRMIDSYFK
ncbi:MAG: TetR family transcriptional regulator [Bacteroidetes bacterium]|nr:TetR family transcriptional regulator [Bacteroidota bacterium]